MNRLNEQFSPRLTQVLALLLTPLSEKQIARRLGLSVHTVHTHIKAVYVTCRVNTRAELMAEIIYYLCDARNGPPRNPPRLAFSNRRTRNIPRQRLPHSWHVSAVRCLRASHVKPCEVS